MRVLRWQVLTRLICVLSLLSFSKCEEYYKKQNGKVVSEPNRHQRKKLLSFQPRAGIAPNVEDYRQKEVWDMIGQMDSFKTSGLYKSDNTTSRPTASSFHYLVVPSWWSHQNKTDPSLLMKQNKMDNVMKDSAKYYNEMSFGKMTMTYEILEQTTIKSTSKKGNARNQVQNYIKSLNYVKDVDYDGIIFMLWDSKAALSLWGASGAVNDYFMWVSYEYVTHLILRHEMGHNFGHDHHSRNHYTYRENRPSLWNDYKSDGHDMMSGGNSLGIVDFHVASKWFFNWVEDSSIIHMQPEGATTECPTCLSSGSFTIKPFDMRRNPSSNDILGVHIPITTQHVDRSNSDYVYSYWLSYRSGVEGIAAGLSIHLVWFESYPSLFGAYYDSLFYWAEGAEDSKLKAVVKNGNCYHVSPASYINDVDLLAAEAVQPTVCVDRFNPGSNIKISVSFHDPNDIIKPAIDSVTQNIQCGSDIIATKLDSSKHNILRFTGTGQNGEVTIKLCNPTAFSKAFFYDDYPYSPITYGSPETYGATQKLEAWKSCKTNNMPSLKYKSDYDETFVLFPATRVKGETTIEASCSVMKCSHNQYKKNGQCMPCPFDKPRSNAGSTTIRRCFRCPAFTELPHPLAPLCTLSNQILHKSRSKGWRIWAPDYHTVSKNRWGVKSLEFYPSNDCSGSKHEADGVAIDSGNFEGGPEGAFEDNKSWIGKKDNDETFWIGMIFSDTKQVRCVKVINTFNSVKNIRVQALVENEEWENVWIQKDLDLTKDVELILSFEHAPTTAPTSNPTRLTDSPTKNPTRAPSTIQITDSPTTNPIKAPSTIQITNSPTKNPIKAPSSSNTNAPVIVQECSERSQGVFLRNIIDGIPKTKTCTWLRKEDESSRKRLCEKNESHGLIKPASKVCPVTCNSCGNQPTISPVQLTTSPTSTPISVSVQPTKYPTNVPTFVLIQPTKSPTESTTKSPTQSPTQIPTQSPTVTDPLCRERSDNLFFWMVTNDGLPKTKSCRWLRKLNESGTERLCQKNTTFGSYKPASKMCPVTCNLCNKGPTKSPIRLTDIPTETPNAAPIQLTKSPTRAPSRKPTSSNCQDEELKKFVYNKNADKGGDIKLVQRSCQWLREKAPISQQSVCNQVVIGYKSAKEICPKTCDNC